MVSTLRRQYDKRSYVAGQLRKVIPGFKKTNQASHREKFLSRVESLSNQMSHSSDEALRAPIEDWRRAVARGGSEARETLPYAFATVREAARRVLGLYPYREQVMAGCALVNGAVAEQATGEGKTLTVCFPAFWFGLSGDGVHVVTVNPYLAARDFEFTQPLFEFLGLTSGLLEKDMEPEKKREVYRKEIVYGTGYDFGFDYLRDQLAMVDDAASSPAFRLCEVLAGREPEARATMHRKLSFAIVDEVDSVLIDEAGSPLVISQHKPGTFDPTPYQVARKIAEDLKEGEDFRIAKERRIILSEAGIHRSHEMDGIPWKALARPWRVYVQNALTAQHLFKQDSHYIVKDEKIVIIDEFTGRAHPERNWKEGLHQAVEVKEAVEVNPETESAASITRQRFYSRYEKICGLTGTALESAGEFWHFFKMPVVPIPLHRPSQREIWPERAFDCQDSMYEAVVESVRECRSSGRPVLIGTRTILASEAISRLLRSQGISHEVLTAKHDQEENRIVGQAGKENSVVIATNMAGRGTHIDLTPESEEAGGLHVIAVERNESVRIDRQLIGRCARQGKPGSSQTFVSLDDELILRTASRSRREALAKEADSNGELPKRTSEIFDQFQRRLEKSNYQIRLEMATRDKWNDQTRQSLS